MRIVPSYVNWVEAGALCELIKVIEKILRAHLLRYHAGPNVKAYLLLLAQLLLHLLSLLDLANYYPLATVLRII